MTGLVPALSFAPEIVIPSAGTARCHSSEVYAPRSFCLRVSWAVAPSASEISDLSHVIVNEFQMKYWTTIELLILYRKFPPTGHRRQEMRAAESWLATHRVCPAHRP